MYVSIFSSYLVFFSSFFFFFNDTPTTQIYTLSLHDALPISRSRGSPRPPPARSGSTAARSRVARAARRSSASDRKSTRLNSSHTVISYAVFCLKKKKKDNTKVNYYSLTLNDH